MVQTRHFFAGSNSGKGFYSLFDNIIGPEAKRIYLLKGGPGTGKSSFMRHIANAVGNRGYDHELFFCSSDSKALDAVSFPKLRIALIDATAPHVMDAELPGCRDQLISLGDFWSAGALETKRDEIIEGGRIKQAHFAAAFRYFAAALAVEENMAARNREKGSHGSSPEAVREIQSIIDSTTPDHEGEQGKIRHLFASALTPEGYVSHIQSLVQGLCHVFVLQGGPGTGKGESLSAIVSHAQSAGHDLEAFHYPLDPHKLLHIIIPGAKIAVLSAISLDNLEELVGRRIPLGSGESAANAGDHKLWGELLQKGFNALLKAQSSHIHIEEYYAQAMDFTAQTAYRDEILAEILS
ncbi:MAG TPA: hypothetical protein DDZ66_01045 [Firmicutes bacterium]|jgi:hypothetical protein|nr:hypothetical protein [Bacillota bacterium]